MFLFIIMNWVWDTFKYWILVSNFSNIFKFVRIVASVKFFNLISNFQDFNISHPVFSRLIQSVSSICIYLTHLVFLFYLYLWIVLDTFKCWNISFQFFTDFSGLLHLSNFSIWFPNFQDFMISLKFFQDFSKLSV